MTRWGLCLVSIGCIIMILSQIKGTASIALCFAGLLVVVGGFMLVYKDKRSQKSLKKPAKKK